jgi:mercuric ion binding protein
MMKHISISLFIAWTLVTGNLLSAQNTVNADIQTKISCSHCSQCETCGLKFDEELYKLKGLKSFTIQGNTIRVSYNPKKINIDQIRLCISNCGYDADDVKATEAGLSKLDGCCRKQEE